MSEEKSVLDMPKSKDVTRMLGITSMTLKRWRESGKIRFLKFPGNVCRYYMEDVEKMLKEGVK